MLMYQFHWEVEVEFDENLEYIDQVHVRILGIDWTPSLVTQAKEEEEKLYKVIGEEPTLHNAQEAITDYLEL
eukprot:CAMPEP_0117430622 /NCGR_PEP_ID=MMETSP0758-20121206/10173_1 /TAXON_ID=63605 /ORGANISM="Percolomonas cosmopolitus, Strain AE-1 (ATCC 50343)" /LENGTH=71 /DNA_ID=CAMNT_0005218849 /DNA_START=384 /DNA_END=595 /DNA_ORIENTATION=-